MYIAVDVGGTQLRVGVYPAGQTKPVKQKRIPTQAKNETPLERLIGLIADLWPDEGQVRAIGLAVPGWVNPEQGIIVLAPNISGWDRLPLVSILEERFHVPVKLGNDANMAVLGEYHYGAGRGYKDIIYMTISTGIGGGVISQGHLLLGANGMAAELGHVTILPDGPLCGCGKRGHLEAIGSGTGIAHYIAEQIAQGVKSSLSSIANPTARDISKAAEQGDPLALAAFNRAGTFIGYALANYIHIFNPSIIILGGGVSRSGDILLQPIRAAINECVISPEFLENLKIVLAELGDDVGLMGALALAQGAVN